MNIRKIPLFALSLLVGCGAGLGKYGEPTSDATVGHPAMQSREAATKVEPAIVTADDRDNGNSSSGQPSADRQIIYTATVDLVVKKVEELKTIDNEITKLTNESGGYLSEFREDRTYGDHPRGHWVVRIPTEKFESFLAEIVNLGVPENRQINAQDVTEDYVDVGRRLSNKKRLEERILKLLDEHTGQIKDVIEVETQLARVREDIESMEGRLRYLSDRIALTTITITARVEEDYTPPQAPRFVTQIQRTFGSSIRSIVTFVQALILLTVAFIPWLAVLSLFIVPLFIVLRRRRSPRGLD